MDAQHNTQFIIRKLGFTHLEYCEMVERGGYDWLDRFHFGTPEVIKACSYSKLFWKWWVNEWNIRDEQFVKHVRFCYPEVEQMLYYVDLHSIQKLGIRPNRFVVTEVNQLIQKIILAEI